MIPAGEAGHVPNVTDDGPGDDGPDGEDTGEGGARGPDRGGELLLRLAELVVEVAQVGEELGGELGAGHRNGTRWCEVLQDPGGLSRVDLFRVAARDQFAEHGVEQARDLIAVATVEPREHQRSTDQQACLPPLPPTR
jgi:hypothetical protein